MNHPAKCRKGIYKLMRGIILPELVNHNHQLINLDPSRNPLQLSESLSPLP